MMKRILSVLVVILLIISILVLIIGCKAKPAVEETAAGEAAAEEPQSPEESEIAAAIEEIDDLETLDQELNVSLNELDNLNLE